MLNTKTKKVSANHLVTQTEINPKSRCEYGNTYNPCGFSPFRGIAAPHNVKQTRDLSKLGVQRGTALVRRQLQIPPLTVARNRATAPVAATLESHAGVAVRFLTLPVMAAIAVVSSAGRGRANWANDDSAYREGISRRQSSPTDDTSLPFASKEGSVNGQ
jgi:hypothetical protein